MPLVDLSSGLRDRRGHLVELECLRGVAIWLVVLYHAYYTAFRLGYGPEGHEIPPLFSFVAAGRTGVTLFFVLSGFLLSLPWLRRDGAPVSARRFYAARALRVLPAYWLAVLVATAFTGRLDAGLRAAAFVNVGMEMYPFSLVWWSLATEVQFYLLLPPAMALAARPGWRWALAGLGGAWAIAWGWAVTVPYTELGGALDLARNSIFGRLPAFLCGIAVAVWWERGRPGERTLRRNRWLATALLLGILLALERLLHFNTTTGLRIVTRELAFVPALEAACWAAMLPVALAGRPFGRRLLVNPVLAFSGKISYSLFLVHLPVIFYVTFPVTGALPLGTAAGEPAVWGATAAALVASLALAVLGFRGIELPFLRLKERLPVFARDGAARGRDARVSP